MPDEASSGSQGPATDRFNAPVIDPTKNVDALVSAATKRLDDLRVVENEHVHEITNIRAAERDVAINHINALITLRAEHQESVARLRAEHEHELRATESARLDAIRAVDRDAVTRAAEVSAAQATALAAAVAASAETLRNQVETSRVATETRLTATIAPITETLEILRAAQYQQQGEKSTQPTAQAALFEPILRKIEDLERAQYTRSGGDSRQAESRQQSNWSTTTIVAVLAALVTVASFALYLSRKPAATPTNLSCSVAAAGMTCVKP